MSASPSILERVFREIMSIGFCVGLPAVYMMLLPVATTVMERKAGVVTATTSRKVFFLVPFQTEFVTNVTRIDDETVRGRLSQTLRSGPDDDRRRPATRAEDMSFIIIAGESGSINVPVSPVNLDDVRRRIREFVLTSQEPQLRIFSVTNWKWSVIGGGLLCVLPLLYVFTILKRLFVPAGKRSVKDNDTRHHE